MQPLTTNGDCCGVRMPTYWPRRQRHRARGRAHARARTGLKIKNNWFPQMVGRTVGLPYTDDRITNSKARNPAETAVDGVCRHCGLQGRGQQRSRQALRSVWREQCSRAKVKGRSSCRRPLPRMRAVHVPQRVPHSAPASRRCGPRLSGVA